MKPVLLISILILFFSCKKETKTFVPIRPKHAIATTRQTTGNIEKRLSEESDMIEYWASNSDKDTVDFITAANEKFETDLIDVLNKYPATLNYEFKQLGTKIGIHTSADKKLRAYSWNTYMGGTMLDLHTVFQYKTIKGVNTKIFRIEDDEQEKEILRCMEIFSVETKNGTIYMPLTFMTESSKYCFENIKFLKIDGENLNYTNIFKTESGSLNEYGVEYVAYWGEKNKPKKVIKYDSEKQILSFAITDDNQNVINKFDSYKFEENHFEKVK